MLTLKKRKFKENGIILYNESKQGIDTFVRYKNIKVWKAYKYKI